MNPFKPTQNKNTRISHFFAISLFTFTLILTLSWAGILKDQNNNTINNSLIAPAGGNHMIDVQNNEIVGSLGQVCVGLSSNPSGDRLFHGVYAPYVFPGGSTGWYMR